MSELPDDIVFGEITYKDEASEFMDTKCRELGNLYLEKQKTPSSVLEALSLRQKRKLLVIKEYDQEIMKEFSDWRQATTEEMGRVVDEILGSDDAWTKEIELQAEVLEHVEGLMDKSDVTNVQLAIIKKESDTELGNTTDYAYLVMYPADGNSAERSMEVSFPTALCHLIDSRVLLQDSRDVEIAGNSYKVSFNKAIPMSDEDLNKVVTEVGRTTLDKIIQGGLSLIDRIKQQEGQHIDPISAITNHDYAVQYALATHRGVGMVSNEKISLPSLVSDKEQNEVSTRDKILSEIESIISEKDETLRAERIDDFVNKRVAELTASSKIRTLTFANGVGTIEEGFIHPDTIIQRQVFVDGLKINDNEVYKVLIESFRQFKTEPGWASKSIREIAQQAITRTLGVYFGNYTSTKNSEMLNRKFYSEHASSSSDSISVSEFKGRAMAVCAEKAPTAENLLTFMGYDSELFMSTNNRLNSPDIDEENGHLFLVVSNENGHFVYDPTNPVVVSNSDGSFYNTFPANYGISDEQYKSLKDGGQVSVTHTDLIWNGTAYQNKESDVRIYGGPKNVKS